MRFLQRLSGIAAVAAAGVAGGDLLLWLFAGPAAEQPLVGGSVMIPASAAPILAAAVALWLARTAPVTRGALRTARALGVIVAIWGALFLLERVPGAAFSVDALLRFDYLRPNGTPATGRLALNTAITVTAIGSALATIHASRPWVCVVSRSAARLAALVTFLAVVGYTNGEPILYQIATAHAIALSTALACLALALGILFADRGKGLPSILVDEAGGGVLARRLLPAAVIVPMLLGRLWLYGERHYGLTSGGGASVFVVATTLAFVWLVARSARVVHAADLLRARLLDREQLARHEAEAANQAKGNFLAVMSHELRTPLSAIIGYEELLADGITGPVTEAQRQQLGRIKASARHLLQLIDEILTYSRTEAGREEVRTEIVAVSGIVDDAVGFIAPMADDKGVTLGVTSPPASLIANTDPRKIRQILINLLSNAVKFTERGGRVTLDVTVGSDRMQFRVGDTGIGIPAEHLQRIFDPFWQVEQQATRRAGGTGLGLSVSRRLARLLDGDISVESTVGRGSTFVVTLPIGVAFGARTPVAADVAVPAAS